MPTQQQADCEAIRALLQRFAAAIEHKDLNQLRAVWPRVPKKFLDDILDKDISSIKMELMTNDPEFKGKKAAVKGQFSTLKVYQQRPMSDQGDFTVGLEKKKEHWIVTKADFVGKH